MSGHSVPGKAGNVRPSSSAPGDAQESQLLYSRFTCWGGWGGGAYAPGQLETTADGWAVGDSFFFFKSDHPFSVRLAPC